MFVFIFIYFVLELTHCPSPFAFSGATFFEIGVYLLTFTSYPATQVIKVDVSPAAGVVIDNPDKAYPSFEGAHWPLLSAHGLSTFTSSSSYHPASIDHQLDSLVMNVTSTTDQEIDIVPNDAEVTRC